MSDFRELGLILKNFNSANPHFVSAAIKVFIEDRIEQVGEDSEQGELLHELWIELSEYQVRKGYIKKRRCLVNEKTN